MNQWWLLLKDILLTGTGIAVIGSQIVSQHPNGLLLGTGLALTVPTIADHVRALLPSGGAGSYSESRSSLMPPESRSSQQEGPTGE